MTNVTPFKQRQATIKASVTLQGVGVHSGEMSCVTIHAAPINHGIVFEVKTPSGVDVIPARFSKVSTVKNATAIGGDNGSKLCTIEHLMAAFSGLGIDNARIEVEGGEIPVLDGSSTPFVDAFLEVGIETQNAARNYLKVLKTIIVKNGASTATLEPYDRGFHIDLTIDFANKNIGKMSYASDVSRHQFVEDVAFARTFGFLHEHEALIAQGLALGASTDNTVIFDNDTIMNQDGLRSIDECVRHKWLDALGDLSLAGGAILGKYTSFKGGHKLNVMMLEALFADSANYEWTSPVKPTLQDTAKYMIAGN